MQLLACPITKVHEIGVPPLDGTAVIVTVSPLVPPVTLSVGVVSLVRPAPGVPVSDAGSSVGADGGVGATVSMVMASGAETVDVLPAGSVAVIVTFHVPSARVGRSQPACWPTMYVQVTAEPPPAGVAETVIVSPLVPPDALTVGVLSFVRLSVDDEPLSDEAARSTVGADGALVSIVMLSGVDGADTVP